MDFLNNGFFYSDLNNTYITLIPKKKKPSRVFDYRPISLCNVLYKLIAKVLANRLRRVLPLIISPFQSAFILGRLITDNVLVAFEALHTLDRRMRKKTGYMALKLDMSKAYDRVKMGFLEGIILKLGFAPKWIQLVMTCVHTVSYSVLINGQPYGRIFPSRGLRQGDPLSPYLFILCAKGLSNLLQRAIFRKDITSLPIACGGVRISHLFFADDSLLFCRATLGEWTKLQEILGVYEQA